MVTREAQVANGKDHDSSNYQKQISSLLSQAGIQDTGDINFLRARLIGFCLDTSPEGMSNADKLGLFQFQ